jgi:hypothetical protein
LRGQPADHRSDIFSFGAVLYAKNRSKTGSRMARTADQPASKSETGRFRPVSCPSPDGPIRSFGDSGG